MLERSHGKPHIQSRCGIPTVVACFPHHLYVNKAFMAHYFSTAHENTQHCSYREAEDPMLNVDVWISVVRPKFKRSVAVSSAKWKEFQQTFIEVTFNQNAAADWRQSHSPGWSSTNLLDAVIHNVTEQMILPSAWSQLQGENLSVFSQLNPLSFCGSRSWLLGLDHVKRPRK